MQSYKIIPKLALISFVFMLSACSNADPMTKNNSPMQQPQPTYDHNSAHLQHSKDYMKAMSQMHTQMRAVESNNVDVAFIQGMIPHHQGAIDMATIQLLYGKDPAMRDLANNIIATQKQEIAVMQHWLKTNAATVADNNDTNDAMAAARKSLKIKDHQNHEAMMAGITDNNPDIAFAKGMIPHHQGAIDMAEMVLQYSQDTSIKSLANQIKQEQQSEIAYMKNWLNTKSN